MAELDPEVPQGNNLLRGTAVGAGVLAAAAALAALLPGALGLPYAVLSCGYFVVGTVALLWAYALGLSRSRIESVSLSGLFFLAGEAAPRAVRRRFGALLALEVVAAVAAASVRPYSEVAFGILAPMHALGLMALWGGRHAEFEARPPA